MNKNNYYLYPLANDNPYQKEEYLESIGWYKLARQRHFTIIIRHIAQTIWNKQPYNEIIFKTLDKYFSNWKVSYELMFLQIFMRALKMTHKQDRFGHLQILQIFDFDNTITKFPHVSDVQDPLSINRLLLKGISMFKNRSPNEYPTKLKFNRIIVSASGDKKGIYRWLEKRNLTNIFKNIYALGGDKEKIHFLYKIRMQWKYDFILYYDDKLDFTMTSLFFLFVPYWITGTKQMPLIKKIDMDGTLPLSYYVQKNYEY